MQDCDGITAHKLPGGTEYVMRQYDRVLLASRWAREIAANSLSASQDVDWMPHGLGENFRPHDRAYVRSTWRIGEDEILVGAVMANQERKHWDVVMNAVARMPSRPRLWLKTDRLVHYWDLQALAIEYGIADRIILDDVDLSDTELAMRYSACDVTMVISGGEGFCYPAAESLACGVPVVAGMYGAQAELTRWTVPANGFRIETVHNVRRAYYDAAGVAAFTERVAQESRGGGKREECVELVRHLLWKNIAYPWKRWIKKGLVSA